MALRLRRGTEAQRLTLTGAQAPAEGEIIYTTDTKKLYVGDGSTAGGNGVSAPVTSVNGQTGTVVLTSNNVAEGNGNLYFTNERAQDAAASLLTSGVHSGLSFTYDATQDTANRIDAALNDAYIAEVAQDAFITLLGNGTQTRIGYAYNDAGNALSLTVNVPTIDTISVDPQVFIASITRGSGYTRHPDVTLSRAVGDTTGSGGVVLAYLIPNALQTIEIINGGTGYVTAPTLTITPDPYDVQSVQATATCTVSGGVINTVTVVQEGNFSRTPVINVTPTNGGSGAQLRAKLFPTALARITVDNPGSGWTIAPIVNITPSSGDTPTQAATALSGLNPSLQAYQTGEDLTFVAGSDKVFVFTSEKQGRKKVTIDVRNIGEIAGGTAGALAYYGSTGQVLTASRGLNYFPATGALQIGSDVQNIDGSVRLIRNNFVATGSSMISSEQYHSNAAVVPIGLARARGTQTTPTAVQNQDRLGSIAFGAHDGTRFVYSSLIAARVENTFAAGGNKVPTNLEFVTSDGVETTPSRVLTLAGFNKTATFNGAVVLKSYTTAQRDALTGVAFGSMIYNTTTNKFQGYQNTGGNTPGWVDLS